MAHLLAKLGQAALKPTLVGSVWNKPKISARVAADLKRQILVQGGAWPYPEEEKQGKKANAFLTRFGFGQRRKAKGHKFEKVKAQRLLDIEKNLEAMDEKIAEYRASRRLKGVSILDQLTMRPKQLRLKYLRATK